ncbi:hypothetical protein OG592_07960 [Streptomyces avidinii]|uniref:hypothetical protein n=1 Tax=Streptomyces avidinii TaxID=1895 RepID=UPI00386E1D27|nr:hypothetical protein OG592_07960 [Streptomyces avidinii]
MQELTQSVQSLRGEQERIETRIEGIETRVGGIETRVGGIETKVENLQTKVDDLQKGQRLISAKLDALDQTSEEQHKGIFDALLGLNDIAHKRITRIEKRLDLPPLE